jgi:hypothetical protein
MKTIQPIKILQGEDIIKDLRRCKKLSKSKNIQEDIEKDYLRLIKQMDNIFEKQFGKMCPDFESGCPQCTAHLIYNNFKKQLHEAFVK